MAKATKPEWKMPEWMEPYRELFQNTGGNEVEWLMSLTGEDTKSNVILAAMVISVESQVTLLHRLRAHKMLVGVDPPGEVPR